LSVEAEICSGGVTGRSSGKRFSTASASMGQIPVAEKDFSMRSFLNELL
jgi:hypothetical protein